MSGRFTKYNGVWLFTSEAEVLQELEDILGRPIPDISERPMGSFGFIHENYHIHELRLFLSYFQEKNQLTELPESVGELDYIHTLDVSHNQLSTLPKSIVNLTELENLYLDYNNFSTIPDEVMELENLRQLNFDDNLLEKIPKDIDRLTYLQSFHLAGNRIHSFPKELLDLKYLRRLDLNRNKIDHLDLDTLVEFSQLYVLDMRNNPIPEIQVDKALALLRLSGKRRRKYYLKGSLNDYENPYSMKNIVKRLNSDPLINFDDESVILEVAKQIHQKHSIRYQ